MKKLFLAITLCLLTAVGAQAQEGKWGVGLNLGYGTRVLDGVGFLGGRVLYDIDPRFDVVGSFNRYFKRYGAKAWDIHADFHWNVYRHSLFEVYPLVGLAYLHGKDAFDNKEGWFGVNLGGGILFNITEHWKIGGEIKGQIMSYSQFVPLITAMYRF